MRLTVAGNRPLHGTIAVRGAKNAISKEMVATLLTDEPCVLRNVPAIRDVEIVANMLTDMDVTVTRSEDTVTINPETVHPLSFEKLDRYVGASRIPILLCGPLLVRHGETVLPAPGGDEIGERRIDFHVHALRCLGATVTEEPWGLRVSAKQLRGTKIALDYASVGATEQILLSAVCAKGTTEIDNAAIEPEIMDLIAVLQKMGALISVEPDRVITIEGVDSLRGFSHTVMPDRLETASWACAALVTKGEIFVKNADQLSMMTFLNRFRQVGGDFDISDEGIRFSRRGENLDPIALETDVHPGFMTDWQSPFVVVLTQASGLSILHETVYENRLGYTEALRKMGARIQCYKECLGPTKCRFGRRNFHHSVAIAGPSPLHGTNLRIPDLRGGFSHVIAALSAEGISTLEGIDMIDRGYEHFFDKLEAIGTEIISLDRS